MSSAVLNMPLSTCHHRLWYTCFHRLFYYSTNCKSAIFGHYLLAI